MLVPIPTLPVLVLLMFPLPSGVVHCAFAATVASKRTTRVPKIRIVKGNRFVIILFSSIDRVVELTLAVSADVCIQAR